MLARAEVQASLKRIGHTIRDSLEQCVEACFDCAKACVASAGDGAADRAALLTKCGRICLDCAQACAAACSRTATAIDAATLRQALESCIAACRDCLAHVGHRHECATQCRRCADRCSAALLQLA